MGPNRSSSAIVSPIGVGREAVWESIESRRSGVRPLPHLASAGWLAPFGGDVANFPRLFSSEVPLPENNHVGNNASRYMNRDLDGLLERYYVTIPIPERRELIGQIIHHISDRLNVMGLFYDTQPVLIAHRLQNVNTARGPGASLTWNAHLWDVK